MIATPTTTRFLTIDGTDKLAYEYVPNVHVPQNTQDDLLKDINDPRLAKKLEAYLDAEKPTEKPLVVMLHDFPEGSHMRCFDDTYYELGKRLRKDGFPTLRFDFRGCGESDGRQQDFCIETAIEDINAMIEWAKTERKHEKIAIVSMGLSVTTAIMTYNPELISLMVMLWPVFRPTDTPIKEIFEPEKMKFMSENDYAFYNEHRIGFLLANELRQMDLIPYLEKVTCPVQIQHGTQDTYAPYSHLELAKAFMQGSIDLGIFEDGEHFLPDPAMHEQMIQNAVYFLGKHWKRQPPAKLEREASKQIIRHEK